MTSANAQPTDRHAGLMLNPVVGLGLGLIAACCTWVLLQTTHPIFHVPSELHLSMGSPVDLINRNQAYQRKIDRRHAMIYLGAFGLLLGAALGIGEGASRRSGLPIGLPILLGGLGGIAGGYLACRVQEYVRGTVGFAEMQHTIAAQMAICVPIALGISLGLAVLLFSWGAAAKTILAGLAAGVLAAVAYPMIAVTLLPTISTDSFLPEEATSRLLWLGLIGAITGLVIPIAGRRRKSSQPPASEPADAPASA
jgi:hypothetical protein